MQIKNLVTVSIKATLLSGLFLAASQFVFSQGFNKIKDLGIENKKQNVISEKINRIKKYEPFEKKELFQLNDQGILKRYEQYTDEGVILKLDEKQLSAILNNPSDNIELEIPWSSGPPILLELTKVEIKSNGFILQGSSGRVYDSPKGLSYHGIIKGEPKSIAAITLFENFVHGIFAKGEGTHVIGQLGQEEKGTYVVYNDRH